MPFSDKPDSQEEWPFLTITGWWFGCRFWNFRIYWVSNHPNWRTHIFRGVALAHQPDHEIQLVSAGEVSLGLQMNCWVLKWPLRIIGVEVPKILQVFVWFLGGGSIRDSALAVSYVFGLSYHIMKVALAISQHASILGRHATQDIPGEMSDWLAWYWIWSMPLVWCFQ